MSGMRIDAGDAKKVTDEFLVDPKEIEVVHDENSRGKLHPEDSVNEMVESILERGQLQAAIVRKIAGNRLKLVLGFRRWRAINRINENKLTSEPLKLRVRVKECNDEEAFLDNIAENLHRQDLSPLDHAHAQKILRERFNWDNKKIASFYKCSVNYVYTLSRANSLPAELKELVKVDKLSFKNAVELTDLPEKKAKEIVQNATQENGKVDADKVSEDIREHKIEESENNEGEGKKKPKNLPQKTLKQVKTFWEAYKTETAGKKKELAEVILKWLSGKILDKTFDVKITAILGLEQTQ